MVTSSKQMLPETYVNQVAACRDGDTLATCFIRNSSSKVGDQDASSNEFESLKARFRNKLTKKSRAYMLRILDGQLAQSMCTLSVDYQASDYSGNESSGASSPVDVTPVSFLGKIASASSSPLNSPLSLRKESRRGSVRISSSRRALDATVSPPSRPEETSESAQKIGTSRCVGRRNTVSSAEENKYRFMSFWHGLVSDIANSQIAKKRTRWLGSGLGSPAAGRRQGCSGAELIDWLVPYLRSHPLFAEKAATIDREKAIQLSKKLIADRVIVPFSSSESDDLGCGPTLKDSQSALYLIDTARAAEIAESIF